MKNLHIVKIWTVSLMSVLVSCTEKGPGIDYDIISGEELVSPETGTLVDLNSVDELKFEWVESQAEDGGHVCYEVLFDVADGDFSSPLAEQASDLTGSDTVLTLSPEQMNEIAGGHEELKWTVRASKGIGGVVYSQINTIRLVLQQE